MTHITFHRILALSVNALLGIGLVIFFLISLGAPTWACEDICDASNIDTTPDYVLIVMVDRTYGNSQSSSYFEDERACVAAGDYVLKHFNDGTTLYAVRTVCAAVESAK